MPLTPILAINVKEYGAIGDGVADDTTAIQDAINAAVYVYPTFIPAPFIASAPKLYFPPGRYKISSTLELTGSQMMIHIIGDNAIIVPDDPDTFTGYGLYHQWCYDVKIEGLNFLDFKKAMYLYNNNLDSSQVIVSRCAFQRNEESLRIEMQSTITVIEKCKFTDNDVLLYIANSDKITVKDCWMTSKTGMTGIHPAPIINYYGKLTMENCLLVPLEPDPVGAIEPAWINNYNCVTVKDTRQGGEPGSFTLVNNFGGVCNTRLSGVCEPCIVHISNCQCYAIYNNSGPNTVPGYAQPAVVRFVDKIPNMTYVENNRGLIGCTIIDFSKYLYNGDSVAIENMIANSAMIMGAIDTINISVKVVDNIGGHTLPNGTFIPTELHEYVRSADYLWPGTRTNGLPILSKEVQLDESIIFKFEYNEGFNTAFLINYSGCPLPSGATQYRGGYVGILKANGFWSDPLSPGQLRQALVLEEIFNQIGDVDPSSWPTGQFTVEAYWDATGTHYLPDNSTNRIFCIKIAGRAGDQSFAWLDQIKVTPLDAM